MNHLKHYVKLIRKAEQRGWTRQGAPCYVEEHHVFPRGIWGENPRKVLLTAREHYVAHALLCLGFKHRYGDRSWKFIKMSHAFWGMSNQQNKKQKRYKSSVLYSTSKQIFSLSISGERNPMFGKECSPETSQKISSKLLRNWSDGTRSKQKAAERIRKTRSNPEVEQRRLENLRKVCVGSTCSDEKKKKIGEAQKNSKDHMCPHCGKTMKAGNYTRWHGNNCKMKKD